MALEEQSTITEEWHDCHSKKIQIIYLACMYLKGPFENNHFNPVFKTFGIRAPTVFIKCLCVKAIDYLPLSKAS